jgi:histidyl-tRNA synthetase
MQCDVDVIDENLDLNYDIEIIETLYKTLDSMFKYLSINK